MGVFQSTLPARGATTKRRTKLYRGQFQSTLPARGATNGRPLCATVKLISIHAPRTGSDVIFTPNLCNLHPISIHAPRTGSDFTVALDILNRIFQSTLPARGATVSCCKFRWIAKFQSTLPARGATAFPILSTLFIPISIHAPRTGSDSTYASGGASSYYFNPRSPHGERPGVRMYPPIPNLFQSTLPARGATRYIFSRLLVRMGFQSTLPARGATGYPHHALQGLYISIHAPRTGSDVRGTV